MSCGWCFEVFLYDNIQNHVHFRNVLDIDYDGSTNQVLPLDERGIPITQDPAKNVAFYGQVQPDPPDNYLDGIKSVSLAIVKCVERHRGLYDSKLRWAATVKMTSYEVIALNVNKSLNLNGTNKLTGQAVKIKWKNLGKGFSRAIANKNVYQYASDLQFIEKYLRSKHAETNGDKENCKRKLFHSQSDGHGERENKKIRISIDQRPSNFQHTVESKDRTLSEAREMGAISANSNKELTAAKQASLSLLSKSSQLQSLEDKVTSAAKATLKQATEVIHEDTSGSLTKEKWSSLTIREAMFTIPNDNLLPIVNGIVKIIQKYMKRGTD